MTTTSQRDHLGTFCRALWRRCCKQDTMRTVTDYIALLVLTTILVAKHQALALCSLRKRSSLRSIDDQMPQFKEPSVGGISFAHAIPSFQLAPFHRTARTAILKNRRVAAHYRLPLALCHLGRFCHELMSQLHLVDGCAFKPSIFSSHVKTRCRITVVNRKSLRGSKLMSLPQWQPASIRKE